MIKYGPAFMIRYSIKVCNKYHDLFFNVARLFKKFKGVYFTIKQYRKKLLRNDNFLNICFKFVYEATPSKSSISVHSSGSKIYLKQTNKIYKKIT